MSANLKMFAKGSLFLVEEEGKEGKRDYYNQLAIVHYCLQPIKHLSPLSPSSHHHLYTDIIAQCKTK